MVQVRRERYFPETLVILGRESLLTAHFVLNHLVPSKIFFAERPKDLAEAKLRGKILLLKTQIIDDPEHWAIQKAMLGRQWRLACLWACCSIEPAFCVSLVPEPLQLEVVN
jgi:hypothetical protein